MAIDLITGIPGAGKTYYAVHKLVELYYKWDKDLQEFRITSEQKPLIITNIEGLALDCVDLKEAMGKLSEKEFFSLEYQEKIHKKHGKVLYIIDEAQRYFHRKFFDVNVFAWFEYHRHLGQDVWLITQDRFKICKDVAALAENEYRAVKRSLSLFGEIKLNHLCSKEVIGRKIIRPSKNIYNIYKSAFVHDSGVKKSRIGVKIIVLILLAVLSMLYLKKRLLASSRPADQEEVHSSSIVQTRGTPRGSAGQGRADLRGAPGQGSSSSAPEPEKREWVKLPGLITTQRRGRPCHLLMCNKYGLIEASHYPFPVKIASRVAWALVPVSQIPEISPPRIDSGGSGSSSRNRQGPYQSSFPGES